MDMSIHPRVENGRTVHGKVNTCKPRGSRSRKYDRKARRLNLRQTACSATKSSVPVKIAAGYRMPGSMNPHRR